MGADELDWNRTLREQWEFHWNHQLRARLDGLTDDEYFWSPVPDTWSVRPARQLDGARAGRCRGLHDGLRLPRAGVRGLGEAGLRVPVGAKEPFPEAPMADLVLHIHRELIHHLSEVCLLRDLYLHTKPATNGATR
jgi:hypothetical protein